MNGWPHQSLTPKQKANIFPPARDLSTLETRQIDAYRLHRQNIHDRPLYCRNGEPPKGPGYFLNTKTASQRPLLGSGGGGRQRNPFNSMELYSTRFTQPPRTEPDWSSTPLVRRLFPKELLDVLPADEAADDNNDDNGDDGAEGAGAHPRKKRRVNQLDVRGLGTLRDAGEVLKGEDGEEGDEEIEDLTTRWARIAAEAEAEAAAEAEEGGAWEEDEEEVPEEEQDYAFEEDEEGDYNAERYFNDSDREDGDGNEGRDADAFMGD
jgi:DNA-directed RNA polymerase III subunit RPC7